MKWCRGSVNKAAAAPLGAAGLGSRSAAHVPRTLQRLARMEQGQAVQRQRGGQRGGLRASSQRGEGTGAPGARGSGGGGLLLENAAVGRHVQCRAGGSGSSGAGGSSRSSRAAGKNESTGVGHGAADQGGGAGTGAEGGRHIRLDGGGCFGLHIDCVGAHGGSRQGLLPCSPGAGQRGGDSGGAAGQGGEGAGGGQGRGRLVGVHGGDAAAEAMPQEARILGL